jgi:hypothetical protein
MSKKLKILVTRVFLVFKTHRCSAKIVKTTHFFFPVRSQVLRIVTLLVLLTMFWIPGRSFGGAATHAVASHPETVSDAQIQQTIQTKLSKSKIGKDGFRFHVSHGVVTWEGTTNVVQHKGSATRMAKAAGATKVVNNIQVSAAARAKAGQALRKAAVSEN